MRVAILSDPPDLSAYLEEILKTWGLCLHDSVGPDALSSLEPAATPVLVCPASDRLDARSEDLLAYARRGGTVVCSLPDGELARAVGLESEGDKEVPLRLRVSARPAAGLAGEVLPVVGRALTYPLSSDAQAIAFLSHPGRYEGESPAIVEASVGEGTIVAFAFDLALSVLLLRQGDPERTEYVPPSDTHARPQHMAVDLGGEGPGWIPYADLLSRLLVDLVRRHLGAPLPLLSHLPGVAPGILLYSGDEDNADVVANDDELEYVAGAGARMNLYMIPTKTQSTVEDVRRYAANNDLGPHPDLTPLDGHPVQERLDEFDRQIRMFRDIYGVEVRSLRDHCFAWAGYLEPVEIMERLGVRMDANYMCTSYLRDRQTAPYVGFGAAMPMRFCHPDGRMIDVVQQHTHLSDDIAFAPGPSHKSLRISLESFEVMLARIFDEMATRFHTPYGVVIHPGNWIRYSKPQGQALLRLAAERGIPAWSYDQWSRFWDVRDTWRFADVSWDGSELRVTAEGDGSHDDLRLMVPATALGAGLRNMTVDGKAVKWDAVKRYHEEVALISLSPGKTTASMSARYG